MLIMYIKNIYIYIAMWICKHVCVILNKYIVNQKKKKIVTKYLHKKNKQLNNSKINKWKLYTIKRNMFVKDMQRNEYTKEKKMNKDKWLDYILIKYLNE